VPELRFRIRWPDGSTLECTSPSTVIREFFNAGEELTVGELIDRSREAFDRASDRVVERYGFRCTAAAAQRDDILAYAERFEPQARVRIVSVG